MDPMIGKMLDNRYELLEVIGSGGMAVVYKAKCHRLNRMVAVKILKSELAQDADFRRRFRDESKAVAMLSHPNIVAVHDVSRGATEYIVMELIDGITLKQYIERRGKLNWREALHFIAQIMKGLSHAHSRGIVHRDIKPQNIMVLRDGSVKVADFGIAYLQNSSNTLTQEALGSVHYISPEQAKGNRPDVRSDIYSAGVVLYEMLTSRLPFEGDSAVSVAIQHLNSVPLTPREINPDVPEALELICMKAMSPDISRRYQSSEDMLADLEEFRKNPDTEMPFTIKDIRRPAEEPTRPVPKITPTEEEREQPTEEEENEEGIFHFKNKWVGIGLGAVCLVLILILGSTIFDSFSGGSKNTTEYDVPKLIGLTVEEALDDPRVKDVFTINTIGKRNSSEYEAGIIMEQDPSTGKVGRMNRVISVWVSAGEKVDTMPNVVGQEYRAARLQVKNLSVKPEIVQVEEFSDSYTTGYVIRTEPDANETLYEGDTVTLYVSKGAEPELVTVPSFTGIPLEIAKKQIEELGLVCRNVTEEASSAASGTVIWQSVAPTSEVASGTQIDLRVSAAEDGESAT